MLRPRTSPRLALAAIALAGVLGCGSDPEPPPPDLGSPTSIMNNLPASCAFECSGCAEPETVYPCPTLKPWSALPHADACPAWDGKYPAVTKGKCAVSDATGEAARKAGTLPGGGVVLPDGHRITPAGREVVFAEPDLAGGFPMSILGIPGTRFALVSDGGIEDNALRLLHLDLLANGGIPVLDLVEFPRPNSLYYGIEWLPPSGALASGGGDAMIYAFDVDTVSGLLDRAPGRDISLGTAGNDPWYAGAIAKTGDGTRLLVAPADHADEVLILSLASADYGTKLATISIQGSRALFDLKLDPFDPEGVTFYASDQSQMRLLEIDGAAGSIKRAISLQKNPAQIAFLDGTYMVVAEADSDSIAVVNRASGEVEARVPVFEKGSPRGFSPSALAYDATNKRLYATLGGVNAVEVYDIGQASPPTITPAGRIPSAWWPTGVMVDADGSVVVVSGKGHGTGTDDEQYSWAEGPITERMRGSVHYVPAADLAGLEAMTAAVEENRNLDKAAGRPEIQCPAGADDFPIPADTESGPSKQIKHVILVIRENKTYDAIFGDRPDLGDGDPKLIMAPDQELQKKLWQNARLIAEQFTNFDNFYTAAEQSIQGHTWTVYGRSNDFMERAWLTVWGRGTRSLTTPLTKPAIPEEGGVFDWLANNGIDYDNMGEIIGGGPPDPAYPGLIYAQNRPDIDKSCYMAGRIRVLCDLKPFTYAVQSNDHTYGGAGGAAAPEVMIAVNDDATGMLLDALSHSPIWQSSLLIVTEDDPQDGGDHVDLHRTMLLMASPWIRRRYVSHGHYDMASVYKLIAHIYGIPYNNEAMKTALLPADAFTSTPDYTPYTYLPREVDAPCNKEETAEAEEAKGWDFEDIDDQPGLSQQIMRMLKQPREARGVRVVKPVAKEAR